MSRKQDGPPISFLVRSMLLVVVLFSSGCEQEQDAPPVANIDPSAPVTRDERIEDWRFVDDFGPPLAKFESVFWDPADSESLRQLIRETPLVKDHTVLEIGTGTGLISLCCVQAGAERVVATDINPAAVANARYNAEHLQLAERLEVRHAPVENPAAYSVLSDEERFDLIISNPPWEDAAPKNIADYALYDEGFALLKSLVAGLDRRLNPGGKALLAYGCVDAIRKVHEVADAYGFDVRTLDDREIDELPRLFVPGMLLELTRRGAE